MPFSLKDLIGGSAGDIVKNIGEVADKFITTKEEKIEFELEVTKEVNRNLEALETEATKQLEIEQQNIANAREMNARIEESEKASWLSKNVAYMIDLIVTSIWASLTIYLVARILHVISETDSSPDMTAVLGIYAGMTATFTTVLQYHRGSSMGSFRKQKQIDKLIDTQS